MWEREGQLISPGNYFEHESHTNHTFDKVLNRNRRKRIKTNYVLQNKIKNYLPIAFIIIDHKC